MQAGNAVNQRARLAHRIALYSKMNGEIGKDCASELRQAVASPRAAFVPSVDSAWSPKPSNICSSQVSSN